MYLTKVINLENYSLEDFYNDIEEYISRGDIEYIIEKVHQIDISSDL